MVLIAASVFTKSGKALVTRQYVADMTRARLEGLLDAFPKLITSDKNQRQHTFVETDSVRYVYQPLDNIYMVLITTKVSNILEDLETLRLFARVIPEYCRSNEEAEISNKAFDLIFAFDEIVVLGYRESVNLAQIRTFTDMDSHEERVFNQMQIAQQKAAVSLMKEKEKEIKRQEKLKKHLKGGISGAIASAKSISSSHARAELTSAVKDMSLSAGESAGMFGIAAKKPIAKQVGSGKALKLGAKSGANEDAFLQQLTEEGVKIGSDIGGQQKIQVADTISQLVGETAKFASNGPVHFKCAEKLNASITRGGKLNSAEVQGSISLCIADPQFNTIVIHIENNISKMPGYLERNISHGHKGAQIQVHPNLDKQLWQTASTLRLKSEQKPYPVGVDVGVLKWTVQLPDEESLPLTLNCWPDESPDGCVVNIEYTLNREDLELRNVQIIVPLPPATAPVISECEGSYEYQKSKSQLVWTNLSVDKSNSTGTFAFTTPNGHADHFFPVHVRFLSLDSCCKIMVASIEKPQQDEEIAFTNDQSFVVEKYEIV